jgi:hypothetical protein
MALQPRRITAKERYHVSVRTIERWEADPRLNFPRSVQIRGNAYDNIEKLDTWDREMAAAARSRLTLTPRTA